MPADQSRSDASGIGVKSIETFDRDRCENAADDFGAGVVDVSQRAS
jgi:hypothetical protein